MENKSSNSNRQTSMTSEVPPKNFSHRHMGQLSEQVERENARQFVDAVLHELPGTATPLLRSSFL